MQALDVACRAQRHWLAARRAVLRQPACYTTGDAGREWFLVAVDGLLLARVPLRAAHYYAQGGVLLQTPLAGVQPVEMDAYYPEMADWQERSLGGFQLHDMYEACLAVFCRLIVQRCPAAAPVLAAFCKTVG